LNLLQQQLTNGIGRLSNDSSVEDSEPSTINSSSSSPSSSFPIIKCKSNMEELRDEVVDSALPRELNVSG